MYKFILPLLLAFVTPTSLSAQSLDFEFCVRLGEHSGQLMNDRQRGLPVSTPREAVREHYQNGKFTLEYAKILLEVIDIAYSFPIQTNTVQKEQLVREFSAYMTKTCLDIK